MKSQYNKIIIVSLLLIATSCNLFDDNVQSYLTEFTEPNSPIQYEPKNQLIQNPSKALKIEQAFLNNAELPNLVFEILDADTSNEIIIEGTLDESPVFVIIKPYKESMLGEDVVVDNASWENRMEICAASDNCKISMINTKILDEIAAPITQPVLYSGIIVIETEDNAEESYCVTVREKHQTLEEYIVKIDVTDDFSQLKTILAELAQVLAIAETINVITGNLSTSNVVLVSNFEKTELHPRISDISNLKFVSFTDTDYYTGLNYNAEYKAPEINSEPLSSVYQFYSFLDNPSELETSQNKIIIDSEPSEIVAKREDKVDPLFDSYISTNGNEVTDIGPYIYNLKEDAYAFGMILRSIGKDLANFTESDQYTKIDFLKAIEVMYKKLTQQKRFMRPSMVEVQQMLTTFSGIPTNVYHEFVSANSAFCADQNRIRIEGQQKMIEAEDRVNDLSYEMLNVKF